MVTVSIILEQKEHAWYIVAYAAVFADERPLGSVTSPSCAEVLLTDGGQQLCEAHCLQRVCGE